jgi:hypothetical protein
MMLHPELTRLLKQELALVRVALLLILLGLFWYDVTPSTIEFSVLEQYNVLNKKYDAKDNTPYRDYYGDRDGCYPKVIEWGYTHDKAQAVCNERYKKQFYNQIKNKFITALVILSLVAAVRGTLVLSSDFKNNTWDYARLSTLSPWRLAVAKMVGASALAALGYIFSVIMVILYAHMGDVSIGYGHIVWLPMVFCAGAAPALFYIYQLEQGREPSLILNSIAVGLLGVSLTTLNMDIFLQEIDWKIDTHFNLLPLIWLGLFTSASVLLYLGYLERKAYSLLVVGLIVAGYALAAELTRYYTLMSGVLPALWILLVLSNTSKHYYKTLVAKGVSIHHLPLWLGCWLAACFAAVLYHVMGDNPDSKVWMVCVLFVRDMLLFHAITFRLGEDRQSGVWLGIGAVGVMYAVQSMMPFFATNLPLLMVQIALFGGWAVWEYTRSPAQAKL